jgi:hypothetical protein
MPTPGYIAAEEKELKIYQNTILKPIRLRFGVLFSQLDIRQSIQCSQEMGRRALVRFRR